MHALLKTGTLLTALAVSGLATATDVEHYKGEPADSLPEAIAHLSEYNSKLAALLEGELTPQAMNEIHQLTYTLENALGRMDQELDVLAETLEEVHQASEHADPSTVRQRGTDYLTGSEAFTD